MEIIKIQKWMIPLAVLLVFFICTAQECATQSDEFTAETLMLMSAQQQLEGCTERGDDCKDLKKEIIRLKRIGGTLPPPPPPCPVGNCPQLLERLRDLVLPPNFTLNLIDKNTKKIIATGKPSTLASTKFKGYNKTKLSINNNAFKGIATMTLTDNKTGNIYPINLNVSR